MVDWFFPPDSCVTRYNLSVYSYVLRAYKYRLYPTETQKVLLAKHFGCVRWVYNWALAEKTARYAEAAESVNMYELQSHIPELKERPDTEWLGEVAAQALQQALRNLDSAFTRFFKHQSAYPVFKNRHDRHQSYQVPQNTVIDFGAQCIKLLKFREGIKGSFNRRFEGKIKTTTVSVTTTGKYYAAVLVDDGVEEPNPLPIEETKALGLDFGLKDLVVTSDGERFENPKALQRYLRRLQIRQRRLSRKTKGSKNRDKARLRVALVHEKISFIRSDNLHKISSKLVRENQATTYCLEDLSVSNVVKNRRLSRSISDAGWRELRRQIEYKAKWVGKNVRIIGRFDPSSKTCSCCGHIKTDLALSDRKWTCVQCGSDHDRDVNAAINIKTFAFRSQDTFSRALLSDNYRQARRKVTPVDQPVRAEMKRECSDSTDIYRLK